MNLCVIGAGYVGLATSVGFAEMGNTVACVETDDEKLCQLKQSKSPLHEPNMAEIIARTKAEGRLRFTSSLAEGMKDAQVVFVAVGTPPAPDGGANLTYITQVFQDMAPLLDEYRIIAIKSTVPVGTDRLLGEILEEQGRKRGIHFDIAFVPEFLREGSAVADFLHPARVVIGSSEESVAALLTELFTPFGVPILTMSPASAQMVKYASNAFLATRVSFINEIGNVCEKLGADVVDVARGILYDERMGKGYLSAGLGFGGPCLEKDLKALVRMSERAGYEATFLQSVLTKNDHQVRVVLEKVEELAGGSLFGRSIAIFGVSFKAGTADVRNSLAVRLIGLMEEEGARVRVHDPYALSEARHLLDGAECCTDPYQAATGADVCAVLTAWPEYQNLDYARLKRCLRKPAIVDAVNFLSPRVLKGHGFTYAGIGRS